MIPIKGYKYKGVHPKVQNSRYNLHPEVSAPDLNSPWQETLASQQA